MNDHNFDATLADVLRGLRIDPKHAFDGFRAAHPFPVAMRLASGGYRVMPTNTHKIPLLRGWQDRASSDPKKLLCWQRYGTSPWQTDSPPCWSILTGRANGIIVLDRDGEEGSKAIAKLESKLGLLPPTWRVNSGRADGGEHIWLKPPAGIDDLRNQQPIVVGGVRFKCDVRGWHGHIVLPGSLHKSRRRYQWVPGCAPDEVDLAECPAEWWAWLPKKEESESPPLRLRLSAGGKRMHREHDAVSLLIGDGRGYGGFQNAIFKNAIQYFKNAGVDAPADIIQETLIEMIREAPKGPGRDVSRYMSGPDLPRQIERAREFVRSVKSEDE